MKGHYIDGLFLFIIWAGTNFTYTFVYKSLKKIIMLRWSLIFLVVAIVAALFGFTGIASSAAGIAKVLFFIFLVLFVLALIGGTFLFKGNRK